MDGIEATRCITAMAPHIDRNPPVIVALTANVCEPDQISRYHASGMIHILAKPIKLNLLEEVLNNIPQFLEKMQERDRKWLEESSTTTKTSSRPPSLGLPSSSLPSTPASSASSSPCSMSCATPVSSTPSPIYSIPIQVSTTPAPPPVVSTPSPPGPLLSPTKGSLSTPGSFYFLPPLNLSVFFSILSLYSLS
jgi:hypothetical protein